MGAEAIRELLRRVDLDVLSKELKNKIRDAVSIGVKRNSPRGSRLSNLSKIQGTSRVDDNGCNPGSAA